MTVLSLITLLLALPLVFATDVTTLTSDNFATTIKSEDLVFVKFFAPWCGHCQAMKEDFEKAATALKGKAVLADVDATTEEKLAKEYNVEGFPTLKLFKGGDELVDYKGGRDEKSMIEFIERASQPTHKTLKSVEDVKEFVKDKGEKTSVVGVELDEMAKIKLTKAVYGIKDTMGEDAAMFAELDKVELVKELGGKDLKESDVKKGDFVLVKEGGEWGVYDSKKYEDLEKWVKTESMPVFGEFTQANADMYTELPYSMCVLFTPKSKKNEKAMKIVEGIAKKKKGNGKLSFAWVDNEKLMNFQEYVGLKDKDPAVCIYSFENDLKYVMPEDAKFNEETFEKFVDDFIAGKVKPLMKSQPIPEKNDEPVKVVVGDTWKSMVEDETKDVLISQTAPWCGHCQALKPVYEKIAKSLGGIDSVVVANMDATENDAPVEYKASGFPTVQFFPSGKNAKMLEYDGERSSKAIIEWMMKYAGKKFEFDTSTLGADPEPEEEPEDDEEGEEGEEGGEEGAAGEEDKAKDDSEAKEDEKKDEL